MEQSWTDSTRGVIPGRRDSLGEGAARRKQQGEGWRAPSTWEGVGDRMEAERMDHRRASCAAEIST